MPGTEHPSGPSAATLSGPLLRYRVVAWITGLGLIVLVLIAMPLKYLADNATPVAIIGPVHGVLYLIYLVLAFALATRAGWSLKGTLLILVAGTIPFLSFVAERFATRAVRTATRL